MWQGGWPDMLSCADIIHWVNFPEHLLCARFSAKCLGDKAVHGKAMLQVRFFGGQCVGGSHQIRLCLGFRVTPHCLLEASRQACWLAPSWCLHPPLLHSSVMQRYVSCSLSLVCCLCWLYLEPAMESTFSQLSRHPWRFPPLSSEQLFKNVWFASVSFFPVSGKKEALLFSSTLWVSEATGSGLPATL